RGSESSQIGETCRPALMAHVHSNAYWSGSLITAGSLSLSCSLLCSSPASSSSSGSRGGTVLPIVGFQNSSQLETLTWVLRVISASIECQDTHGGLEMN